MGEPDVSCPDPEWAEYLAWLEREIAAGQVDEARAGWIAFYTRSLSAADAARADEILAVAAPDLRVGQLARKAAALEVKLNPEAVAARKQRARRDEQRVEARRESSGNASLSGRELDTADVLASKAHIDAVAARLRDSGLVTGTLDQLRARAFADLTQGRDPLNRIKPPRRPRPPSTRKPRTQQPRTQQPRTAAGPGQPPGSG